VGILIRTNVTLARTGEQGAVSPLMPFPQPLSVNYEL
jgi:hypothetical protein